MTNASRAGEGRPAGRNQLTSFSIWLRTGAGKRETKPFLAGLGVACGTLCPGVEAKEEPAESLSATDVACGEFEAAAKVRGKMVSTASVRQAGSVKASAPERKPQTSPIANRKRYGLANCSTFFR